NDNPCVAYSPGGKHRGEAVVLHIGKVGHRPSGREIEGLGNGCRGISEADNIAEDVNTESRASGAAKCSKVLPSLSRYPDDSVRSAIGKLRLAYNYPRGIDGVSKTTVAAKRTEVFDRVVREQLSGLKKLERNPRCRALSSLSPIGTWLWNVVNLGID